MSYFAREYKMREREEEDGGVLTPEPQGIYAYENVGPDQCEKGIYIGTNKKSAGG